MKISSENIEKALNTILKEKYPELSYGCQVYDDRDGLTHETYTRTNIWITAPVGFYGSKSSYDTYYDDVESDVNNILKMFGIFRRVNLNWLEGDTINYDIGSY
jgi:hypothetical protein